MVAAVVIQTDLGRDKLAKLAAEGKTLKLTQFAVGDANDKPYTPTGKETKLVHEKYRSDISLIEKDEVSAATLKIINIVPSTSGGYTIHEIGLFDEDNDLVAIGVCEIIKPDPKVVPYTSKITILLTIDNAESVEFKINIEGYVSHDYALKHLQSNTFKQDSESAVNRLLIDKVRDTVSILDFGAIPDGKTDCYDAIMNAINSKTFGTPWYVSGPAIYFPPGTYFCSKTIQLKKSVRLLGDASGLPTTSNARIIFPAGVSGIIVHSYNTYSNYVETTPTTAGDGSSVEGLILQGTRGDADIYGGHGIWMRARALIKNCLISGFEGNGVHIYAATNGGPDFRGNANCFNVSCSRIITCKTGVFIQGYDTNAGVVTAVDCTSNREWGFFDGSFLGNTLIACHAAANGINVAALQTAYARYENIVYHAVPSATEEQLRTTQPGTNTNVWRQCNNTNYAITWTGDNPVGTFRQGGGYCSTNINARGVWIGCYSEGGQGLTWGSQHSLILGGFFLESPVASGGYMQSRFGILNSLNGYRVAATESSGVQRASVLGDGIGFTSFEFSYKTPEGVNNYGNWRYRCNGYDLYFDNMAASAYNSFVITGIQTKATFGTSTIHPAYFSTQRFALGNRRMSVSTAIPTTGAYARGDIIYNINPTFGGYIGWVCVVAGSPGTWSAFGKIEG